MQVERTRSAKETVFRVAAREGAPCQIDAGSTRPGRPAAGFPVRCESQAVLRGARRPSQNCCTCATEGFQKWICSAGRREGVMCRQMVEFWIAHPEVSPDLR